MSLFSQCRISLPYLAHSPNYSLPLVPITFVSSGQLFQINPLTAEPTDCILLLYTQSLIFQFLQLEQILSLPLGSPTINFSFRRWSMQSPLSNVLCVHETVPKSKVVLHIALTFKNISARGQSWRSWDKGSRMT